MGLHAGVMLFPLIPTLTLPYWSFTLGPDSQAGMGYPIPPNLKSLSPKSAVSPTLGVCGTPSTSILWSLHS